MSTALVVMLSVTLLAFLILLVQHRALSEEVERLQVLVDKIRYSAVSSTEDIVESLAALESEIVSEITWKPTGERFPMYAGMSVLQVMQLNGLPVSSACGGRLQCGQCKIWVGEGAELADPDENEAMYLADETGRYRLSCALSNTKNLKIGPKELPAL